MISSVNRPQPQYIRPSRMPREFTVGIPTDRFERQSGPQSVGLQRMQNWCWAACIQMVLNFHGVMVRQEDLVQQRFGALIDRPACPREILSSLTGNGPDVWGGRSVVFPETGHLDQEAILQELEAQNPLIVGLQQPHGGGHAYVLTAGSYQFDGSGRRRLHSVVLRNPYPGTRSREEMSMQEFSQRCTFATRVHVVRQS